MSIKLRTFADLRTQIGRKADSTAGVNMPSLEQALADAEGRPVRATDLERNAALQPARPKP